MEQVEGEPDQTIEHRHQESEQAFGFVERVTMAIVAIILGTIAGWMFWIVRTFLDGHGWFDIIVGLVLEDLILSVFLFSLVLVVWALFHPAWLIRVFAAAYHSLTWALLCVGILFVVGLLILFLVVPILIRLGVLR